MIEIYLMILGEKMYDKEVIRQNFTLITFSGTFDDLRPDCLTGVTPEIIY